jgi:two-component system cell cycle sensor histidine kinase/response regulator CckA
MAFLGHLFARPTRLAPPESELPAASVLGTARIDPGEFATAQMVHDVQSQIAELHRCGEQATQLVRTVLTAGRPREVRRALNLNEVITHASTMLACVTGPWIRLQFRLAPEPVRVFARIFEIERILLNLVLNARDAIAADGAITIETAPADESAPGARLTIVDTGTGMNDELRERVFEPFFTTKQGATGLGLTSVAFTVQQLGGTVAVRSRPGGGTSLVVVLPQVQDLVYRQAQHPHHLG